MRAGACLAVLVATLLATGCGGKHRASSAGARPSVARQIDAAARVSPADFPAPAGRTLQAIASSVKAGPQVGLGSSILLPGPNRIAFGVIGADNKFLYGKTALYFARTPQDRAKGPFPAPADSLVVAPAFVSQTSSQDPADIKAIYASQISFPRPGPYAVLAVSKVGSELRGGTTQITVLPSSQIPNVGQRPPRISTDTVASVHGNIAKIDTRVPHDDMHKVNFKDVIGKRPVALLFSTPQLCQSRVCGPVTDVAMQVQSIYGKRVTFIHEEVYVDNQVKKGLRPQLRAFHLQSEPWLFTFDRGGRVAARLEGAFGIGAFRSAVQAALR